VVCGNVDHAVLIHLVGIIMSPSLYFLNSVARIDLFGTFFFLSVGGIICSVLFVGWYNCGCCSVSPDFMLRRSYLGKRSAMFLALCPPLH
jgi:hypothetical protein